MAIYRLYCLDDGQIQRVDYLPADDDETAIAKARTRHPAKSCELWLGSKLVAAFVPHGGEADRSATERRHDRR